VKTFLFVFYFIDIHRNPVKVVVLQSSSFSLTGEVGNFWVLKPACECDCEGRAIHVRAWVGP